MMKKLITILLALAMCAGCLCAVAESAPTVQEMPVSGLSFTAPQAFDDARGGILTDGAIQIEPGLYVTYWYYSAADEEEFVRLAMENPEELQARFGLLFFVFSVGGGSVRVENEPDDEELEIYPEKNLGEILEACRRENMTLPDWIRKREGDGFPEYLSNAWRAMREAVERGVRAEGILPGGLDVNRKAKILYEKRCYNESADVTMNRVIAAYAYAVSEENASENIVVTAPTCGSCGVIPAVFYYMQKDRGFPEEEILDALAVAGMIGNVIRTNASISGAECGCQAEIGSACSMAAAGLAALYRLNLEQIEYAAEIAMEHHLGLTCDPVGGLVQIPCIERNAVAAMRAISAVNLSRFLYETRKISFDVVIDTMYQTGKDMNDKYRETSHGGLAQMYRFFANEFDSRSWLQDTLVQMMAEEPDPDGEEEAYGEWKSRVSTLQDMIDAIDAQTE